MDKPIEHIYKCTMCNHPHIYICDAPEVPVGEIHYYHHNEDKSQPHSVEVSRNAKGEYSFSVKAYGETIEEAFVKCKDGVRLALEEVKNER